MSAVGPLPPRDTRNGDPQHWMPANFKHGTPLRPKRAFESKEEAEEFNRPKNQPRVAYQCSTCGMWHLATKKDERAST